MNSKPFIALDVDEVLAQFLPECNKWYNQVKGTTYTLADYRSYSFGETWGVDYDQTIELVYEFFTSDFFKQLPVVPGAKEAVRYLAEHFNLAVVTSRQMIIRDETIRWLNENFGEGTFKHVLFGNIWVPRAKEGEVSPQKRSKREMCESINAQCLVDDQPKYIHDVQQVLPLPILFNLDHKYRWIDETTSTNLIAHSWPEAIHLINAYFKLPTPAYLLRLEQNQLLREEHSDSQDNIAAALATIVDAS